MRAVAAQDRVETAIFERQQLRRSLLGRDIREPDVGRCPGDRRKHLPRQIVCDDLARMWRCAKGHMPAAAAEIEDARLPQILGERDEGGEVGALPMNGAVEIGRCLRAELVADQRFVSFWIGHLADSEYLMHRFRSGSRIPTPSIRYVVANLSSTVKLRIRSP